MSFKFSCYRHEPPPFSDQTYRQTVGQHAGSDVQSQNMPENGENGQTTPKTYMYKIMGGGTLRIHTYTHTCTHNNKHFWFKPCKLRQVQHPRGPRQEGRQRICMAENTIPFIPRPPLCTQKQHPLTLRRSTLWCRQKHKAAGRPKFVAIFKGVWN